MGFSYAVDPQPQPISTGAVGFCLYLTKCESKKQGAEDRRPPRPEVLYVSKLDCAKIIPIAEQKISKAG
jgi:hypothetical protein